MEGCCVSGLSQSSSMGAGAPSWCEPVITQFCCCRGLTSHTVLLQCRQTVVCVSVWAVCAFLKIRKSLTALRNILGSLFIPTWFFSWKWSPGSVQLLHTVSLTLVPFVCLSTQKSWRAAEDVSDTLPRERALKSVSFQESVSVITDRPATMELESQQIQHGCLSSPSNRAHGGVGVKAETPDSEVVQVCRFSEQDPAQMFSFLFYYPEWSRYQHQNLDLRQFILGWPGHLLI